MGSSRHGARYHGTRRGRPCFVWWPQNSRAVRNTVSASERRLQQERRLPRIVSWIEKQLLLNEDPSPSRMWVDLEYHRVSLSSSIRSSNQS